MSSLAPSYQDALPSINQTMIVDILLSIMDKHIVANIKQTDFQEIVRPHWNKIITSCIESMIKQHPLYQKIPSAFKSNCKEVDDYLKEMKSYPAFDYKYRTVINDVKWQSEFMFYLENVFGNVAQTPNDIMKSFFEGVLNLIKLLHSQIEWDSNLNEGIVCLQGDCVDTTKFIHNMGSLGRRTHKPVQPMEENKRLLYKFYFFIGITQTNLVCQLQTFRQVNQIEN